MTVKSKKRWPLILALVALGIFGLFRLYYQITDDFRIANMTYEIPFHREWEIPALTAEEKAKIDQIVSQKFSYLGKGAQSYVFLSDDGKYVLKFFKFKHLKPSAFHSLLPRIPPFAHYRDKEEERKKHKLESVFTGHRLAYETHKQESGLVFIHLNKTQNLHRTVTVYDKIGLTSQIPLDDVVFVIQERGETLRTVLNALMKEGNLSLAKQRIRQVFDLYISEYKKGIYDHDHGVMHNTGFIGEHPLHLDIGKLNKDDRLKDPKVYRQDFDLIFRKITLWLRTNYSQEYPEMLEDMQAKYVELFGEKYI